MPCAFHLDHHERSDSGCQFSVSDDRLITFAGRTWCPFHLPLEAEGEESEKVAWQDDKQKIEEFNEEIFAFVRHAKQRDVMADLSGIVFPAEISFEPFSGEDDDLPTILFIQASFRGFCFFSWVRFGRRASFQGASFGGNAWFEHASFGEYSSFKGASFGRVADFSGSARPEVQTQAGG